METPAPTPTTPTAALTPIRVTPLDAPDQAHTTTLAAFLADNRDALESGELVALFRLRHPGGEAVMVAGGSQPLFVVERVGA